MAIFDWLQRTGSTRLEQACRDAYEHHLDSPSAQMTIAEARAAGWGDDRIIWEFHRANWESISRDAVEQVGSYYAGSQLRLLTETERGWEIGARTMTEVFRDHGYDVATIEDAIERSKDGSGPTGAGRRTWPTGWKALVVVGAASVTVAGLGRWWPELLTGVWPLFPGAGLLGGSLVVVLGLLVRRGLGWARWAGLTACVLAGLGILVDVGSGVIDTFEPGLVTAGVLGAAYLVAAVVLWRSEGAPVPASRGDLSGRVLHIVAWAVLAYVFVGSLLAMMGVPLLWPIR